MKALCGLCSGPVEVLAKRILTQVLKGSLWRALGFSAWQLGWRARPFGILESSWDLGFRVLEFGRFLGLSDSDD